MKNCSYCGRENGDEVAQCRECGTVFDTESTNPQATQPMDDSARVAANKRVFWGAAWCLGGILVTVLTYAAAASSPVGGTYVVAWGAIVFGAIQIVRGLAGRNAGFTNVDLEENNDSGEVALAEATELETQGRIQEALDAYQRIAENYPGHGSRARREEEHRESATKAGSFGAGADPAAGTTLLEVVGLLRVCSP